MTEARAAEVPLDPLLLLEHVRRIRFPMDEHLGLEFESVSADEVAASIAVNPDVHMAPQGIVHGGLFCVMAETVATVGAMLTAIPTGRIAVGADNHTNFLRPVREGRIFARARPVHRGSQLHLWQVEIHDERQRLVAQAIVRLALLPRARVLGE